jgi:integral membrane protein (TIGR01906 family)
VRAFVIRGEGALPARVEGREGFESAAVSHLEDVRDVLRLARIVTGLIAVTLAAWIAWALSRTRFRDVGEALRYGALVGVVGVSIAIAFAIVDFDTFFTAFHGLFFADGTWTFPGDSLLIQLFPEPFWASLGGAWGVLAGLTMVGYWVIGTKLLDEGFDERA